MLIQTYETMLLFLIVILALGYSLFILDIMLLRGKGYYKTKDGRFLPTWIWGALHLFAALLSGWGIFLILAISSSYWIFGISFAAWVLLVAPIELLYPAKIDFFILDWAIRSVESWDKK